MQDFTGSIQLRAGLLALLVAMGVGGGAIYVEQLTQRNSDRDAYIQAVANDTDTSNAVKIAMVMGSFYESS